MRFLIITTVTICIALTSMPTQAKIRLAKSCKQYTSLAKSAFILFNKQELISLGECVAQDILRMQMPLTTLVQACNEIKEADGLLGITALSKAEAIRIGQCLGAINYVDTRFHGTKVNIRNKYGRRSNLTYNCARGQLAVDLIVQHNEDRFNSNGIRNIICEPQ